MNRSLILISSVLALIFIPSCKSNRTHTDNLSPAGIAGTKARSFTSAWMTDGSLATFTDTLQVTGVQAAKKLFLKDDFECIPDHRVAIGELTVPADPRGYEGEAEWAIRFPKPISHYQEITPAALEAEKLELVGMIEGKALSRLGDADDTSWASSSVGNNVITPGAGYQTTLCELQRMSGKRAQGALWLEAAFHHADDNPAAPSKGRLPHRKVDISEREVQKVLATETFHSLVTVLARASADPKATLQLRSARLLNLSALGRESAAVNNSSHQMPAFIKVLGRFPFSSACCRPGSGDRFRDLIRAGTVSNLVTAGDSLPEAGGVIQLTFHHPKGADSAELKVGNR